MKRNFWKLSILVMCLEGVTRLIQGAEGTPGGTNAPTITLEALVSDVLEHNPELNFYRAEIAAARGERRSAGTWANPELSGTAGGKRVEATSPAGEGLAWSVSMRQTLEWRGRIPLRKAIANRQIQLAELGFSQFRAALAGRARTLAYGLFAAQEKAAAAREVADRFQALREVLVQRDAAGLTPLLETRIIEATELTMQRRASEAAVLAQSALLELNQLRSQPWQQGIQVQPRVLSFPMVPESEALLMAARTNNFELRMRQVEMEQQGFKVSLAKNERYPSVTVGPYFSEERAGDLEHQAGLGLSLPLPLWNRNQGKIETEEARRQQAATSVFLTLQSVERQVMDKALTYQNKVAEMSKWRPDSVQQFKEAAALADRHYRLGAAPIATYVELQKQYLEAVDALLDTRREALDAGQQIQLLTGLDINAGQPTQPNQPEDQAGRESSKQR
jgi:outer membrane protein, heavy metal efflux system